MTPKSSPEAPLDYAAIITLNHPHNHVYNQTNHFLFVASFQQRNEYIRNVIQIKRMDYI